MLVPGWSMPATIWAAQLTALAVGGAVYALDPRGQGESEVPAHGYDIARRAADLHEFATAHAPVIMVGWSLAALETLEAIHLFGTAPVSAVVLVDSSVGEDPPPPPGAGFIERLRIDRARTLDSFVRAIFRTPPSEQSVRELVAGALRIPLDASIALFPSAIPREHWREIARALSLPLLYAVTESFAEQAANLRAHRPDTSIEVFHGAGHALFVDQPERFSRLLRRFADDVRAD
ncbi:MAG: alpha/beta fold hydrolase [Proteobacteria bacterium]|nr:alpha/beta fold hydrolase [Burkholderiales bacterium]